MDKFVQLPFVIPTADPALLENYISKLFLQDEIHNLEEKHVQVRKAAKDVADEEESKKSPRK